MEQTAKWFWHHCAEERFDFCRKVFLWLTISPNKKVTSGLFTVRADEKDGAADTLHAEIFSDLRHSPLVSSYLLSCATIKLQFQKKEVFQVEVRMKVFIDDAGRGSGNDHPRQVEVNDRKRTVVYLAARRHPIVMAYDRRRREDWDLPTVVCSGEKTIVREKSPFASLPSFSISFVMAARANEKYLVG